MSAFRERCICEIRINERKTIADLFQKFENVLGPVGAAKVLHLLAHRVFPIWDRKIAQAYRVSLGNVGTNGERYWKFILISQEQCNDLPSIENPLKSIDEYNYCKCTLKVI